mmetsp:Transcript_13199/g.28982  ORF Transcript_13199/g.28982 Transcript_13199/m.28982 type:complete len:86 (-) Transcript_13199:42-299(-)
MMIVQPQQQQQPPARHLRAALARPWPLSWETWMPGLPRRFIMEVGEGNTLGETAYLLLRLDSVLRLLFDHQSQWPCSYCDYYLLL